MNRANRHHSRWPPRCSRHRSADRRVQLRRRQDQGRAGAPPAAVAAAPRRRRRAADRALHPRHRHADGRRTGRRRRRNRRPRRRRRRSSAARRSPQGAELIRVSATETDAQLKEAEANAAQIEARLGLTPETAFDVNAVPEVQNAKASFELAQSEFARIKSLLDQRVVSQSEFDQRRTQMEAARQQYEAAKNGAAQQYQIAPGRARPRRRWRARR